MPTQYLRKMPVQTVLSDGRGWVTLVRIRGFRPAKGLEELATTHIETAGDCHLARLRVPRRWMKKWMRKHKKRT